MNQILLAIFIVAGIGLIAGLGLAIASIVMAVPKDEKAEAIQEILPGANCGACGYSGCAGYASARRAAKRWRNRLPACWGSTPDRCRSNPPLSIAWAAMTILPSGWNTRGFLPVPPRPSCSAAQGNVPMAVSVWGTAPRFANMTPFMCVTAWPLLILPYAGVVPSA